MPKKTPVQFKLCYPLTSDLFVFARLAFSLLPRLVYHAVALRIYPAAHPEREHYSTHGEKTHRQEGQSPTPK